MAVGAVEKVTKAMEGVDTVVIVEENICNKNKRKDLLGLISTLQKAYNKEGEHDADGCYLLFLVSRFEYHNLKRDDVRTRICPNTFCMRFPFQD